MSERMGAEHYGALAGGDDDDGGVDRRTSGDLDRQMRQGLR
jgi:hypothetical protein